MVRKLRKGFTLVELLIVIVIIGILAAAMLLSSGSASDRAEAAKLISNIRTIKAAYLMYLFDNPNLDSGQKGNMMNLLPYLDNPAASDIFRGYAYAIPGELRPVPFFGVQMNVYYSPGVKRIMASKARTYGYYGAIMPAYTAPPIPYPLYDGGNTLWFALPNL